MASTKQNDTQKSLPADIIKGHGLSLSNSKLESYSGMSDENDRNSNLSPSKSGDPAARKKTFKITSVKKGGTGSGDVGGDNDADSIDGLDESQTEDLSSEFYDSSKATDLDVDLQDCINIPLTPDELTSTTTIVVKQKPDQNSQQSRFKVVKIETKEPFRRGKWVCYDFFDTAPAAMVTVEKMDSRITDDSIIHSALAGNLSASSSVHYVQDVNDSSSNIFIPPIVPMSSPRTDGHPMLSDVFIPIQPAPASQVLSQLDGLTSDVMAPFIAQQVLMSVASVPSTSTSYHNLAQTGHSSMIQSLPHTGLFSFPQNGSSVTLFQNGVAGQSSQMTNLPSDSMLGVSGSVPQTVMAPPSSVTGDDFIHSQASLGISGVPHSKSQTQITGDTFVAQGLHLAPEPGQSSALRHGVPAPMPGVQQTRIEAAVVTNATDTGDHMGLGMDKSNDSIKTLQGSTDGQTSEGLKEAVEAVGEMYMGLEAREDDADERNSEVATLFSNLHERRNQLPLILDYRNSESPPYGRCLTPMRSPCASPLPPTFIEHPDFPVGMFPVRSMTPSFPCYGPLPNFFEPVANTSNVPGPIAFQHTESYMPTSYFPAPPTPIFSPFVPFGATGDSATSGFMPESLVARPSRPCSMVSIPLPGTSLTRSMSMAQLSPASAGLMPDSLTVSPPSKPCSMASIPLPGTSLTRSMSVAHLSPASAFHNVSHADLAWDSRSMSATSVPAVSISRSVSPVAFSFDPQSMPANPHEVRSFSPGPPAFDVRNFPPDFQSRYMSPAPPASISRSMSMTCLPSAAMYSNTALSGDFPFTVSHSMLGQHLSPPYEPFQSLFTPMACFTDQARRQSSVSPEQSTSPMLSPLLSPLQSLPTFSPLPRMESPDYSPHGVPFKEGGSKPTAVAIRPNMGQSVTNISDILGSDAHPLTPNKQPSEHDGYVLCLLDI